MKRGLNRIKAPAPSPTTQIRGGRGWVRLGLPIARHKILLVVGETVKNEPRETAPVSPCGFRVSACHRVTGNPCALAGAASI